MYIVAFVILLVPSSARSKLYICLAQVSSSRTVQDVLPSTMFQDGNYVSGELWHYWRETFPRPSIVEMFAFITYDIDDERTEFVRSLAW